MKKVAYTVILGDYKFNKLNEPKYNNKGWSLKCFTDKKISSKHWDIININHNNPLKKSREIKIRCDKFIDFDICLYLDSRFNIRCNLDDFVDKNFNNDILLMKHMRRNCAYTEANYCISKNRGNRNNILRQKEQYQKEGFPKNFGLYACGIMLRRNTPDVINFMKLWYDEVYKYSYRDQISFPYTLWKFPIKPDVLNFRNTCKLFRR